MYLTVTSKDTGGEMLINPCHIIAIVEDGKGSVWIRTTGDDAVEIEQDFATVKILLSLIQT